VANQTQGRPRIFVFLTPAPIFPGPPSNGGGPELLPHGTVPFVPAERV